MNSTRSVIVASLATASTLANAQTFLITKGSTLYRHANGHTQVFSLSSEITGMTTVPAGAHAGSLNGAAQPGDILAVANADAGNIAYRLDNPLATPSLTQVGVMGGGGNNSPVFANGSLFGVLLGVNFLEYDQTTLAGSNTWNTGVFGGSGGLVHTTANDFLFVEGLTDALYHYTIAGTGVPIGPLGVDFENSAMETYAGTTYAALGRVDTGQIALGTINPSTGSFTQIAAIDSYEGQSIGLAIVPSPGPLALVSVGAGLALVRRRR